MKIKTVVVITVLLAITACASTPKVSTPGVNLQEGMSSTSTEVVLGPGDVIDVKFRFLPELNYEQTIRPDGKISLQMVDEVVAAGRSPEELDKHLTELYSTKLKSPEITVIVVSLADQVVYVGGEVENPGVIPLVGQLTAVQAIMNSGGFKETAAPANAIIIRKDHKNQPAPFLVNLQKIVDGNDINGDTSLRPADIVYVPKSRIAKINKFVRQYIQDLLLFRGASLGFSYELHAENND